MTKPLNSQLSQHEAPPARGVKRTRTWLVALLGFGAADLLVLNLWAVPSLITKPTTTTDMRAAQSGEAQPAAKRAAPQLPAAAVTQQAEHTAIAPGASPAQAHAAEQGAQPQQGQVPGAYGAAVQPGEPAALPAEQQQAGARQPTEGAANLAAQQADIRQPGAQTGLQAQREAQPDTRADVVQAAARQPGARAPRLPDEAAPGAQADVRAEARQPGAQYGGQADGRRPGAAATPTSVGQAAAHQPGVHAPALQGAAAQADVAQAEVRRPGGQTSAVGAELAEARQAAALQAAPQEGSSAAPLTAAPGERAAPAADPAAAGRAEPQLRAPRAEAPPGGAPVMAAEADAPSDPVTTRANAQRAAKRAMRLALSGPAAVSGGAFAALSDADQPLTQIFFSLGNYTLGPNGKATLERTLPQLTGDERAILIVGSADPSGTESLNDKLSDARAQSVAEWLLAHGVDAGRIQTRAIGQEAALGSMLDRRVDIWLGGSK